MIILFHLPTDDLSYLLAADILLQCFDEHNPTFKFVELKDGSILCAEKLETFMECRLSLKGKVS